MLMLLLTQLDIISVLYFVMFVNKLFRSRKQKEYCIHLPQTLKESWRTKQIIYTLGEHIRALSVPTIIVGILYNSVR